MRNLGRRKELGKMFFDVSKYLFIAVAAVSIVKETGKEVNVPMILICFVSSVIAGLAGYLITPLDKE